MDSNNTDVFPIPVGSEDDEFAQGIAEQPVRLGIIRWAVGKIANLAVRYLDHIDLVIAVPVAGKRDPCSIQRPGGLLVICRVVRKVDGISPVGVHDVDLVLTVAVGRKGNLSQVRGPGSLGVGRRVIGYSINLTGIIC